MCVNHGVHDVLSCLMLILCKCKIHLTTVTFISQLTLT